MTLPEYLPEYKKTRVKRIIVIGNWPLRHLEKDGMLQYFRDEYNELQEIREKMIEKARRMGVKIEEEY